MTSLSTTWTEQSVVAFTAGTLNTIADCTTEVESKLKRGTLGSNSVPTQTEVQRWLIRAKQELAEIKNYTWSRKYSYASTASGTYRYALPADYHGGDVILRDTTNDRELVIYPQIAFDSYVSDPSDEDNDLPYFACIRGRELWLQAPANGTYVLELEYNRSGDDSTSTDFSWLPEIDRFRCCDFAVWQSFLALHEWDAADRYGQQWMFDMTKARKADGKVKWKNMNYSCPLWLNRYGRST